MSTLVAPSAERRRRILDVATTALFCAVLLAPAADLCVREDEARSPVRHELRTAAPAPELRSDVTSIALYPRAFEAHFTDGLGLRDHLIGWDSVLHLAGFGVSPTPRVEPGARGWLFYSGERLLLDHRGLRPFSAAELESWRLALTAQRDWCRARGIEFLFVLGPNKQTIYPDLMPPEWNVLGPTRLEELHESLRTRSDVELFDLRPALRAARAAEPDVPLYYPHGTHWSAHGELVAARAIVERLRAVFPAIDRLEDEDVVSFPVEGHGDSWTDRMYATSLAIPDLEFLPEVQRARTVERTGSWQGAVARTVVDDPRLPRAVFLHDSFGASLEHLLGERFSRTTWHWKRDFDAAEIEADDPDVVILFFVEYVLLMEPPLPFVEGSRVPHKTRDELRARFDRSTDVLWRLGSPLDLTARGTAQVEAEPDDGAGAVRVSTRDARATIVLSGGFEASDRAAILRVEVTSPVATHMRVFFLRPGDVDYARKQTAEVALVAGRNEVFLPIDAVDLAGPPMIRPGDAYGEYRFHSIELRPDPP